MTFTWANGRQLSALTESDGTQISYQYNMDGIRTKKTVGNVTTEYIVSGGMILEEIHEDVTYRYYYNESGAPVAMKVGSGDTYFFEKNAQGDIVALFNNSGAEVARISYDAYGNTLYIDNPDNLYIPFRYRGYYYDADTGFYYLQSRYYDPETGRFINADATSFISQNYMANVFAYCGNNTIMHIDPTGHAIVSIRKFIESRGGTVLWFSEFSTAIFELNGIVLRTAASGRNAHNMAIANNNGRMVAQNYELAYYFKIQNWSTYFPGFAWNDGDKSKGFMVDTTWHFLSKNFCKDYAKDVMKAANAGLFYCGNTGSGVAVECYSHAVLLVYSKVEIMLINHGYKFRGSARQIGYEAWDWHTPIYNFIWNNCDLINPLANYKIFNTAYLYS